MCFFGILRENQKHPGSSRIVFSSDPREFNRCIQHTQVYGNYFKKVVVTLEFRTFTKTNLALCPHESVRVGTVENGLTNLSFNCKSLEKFYLRRRPELNIHVVVLFAGLFFFAGDRDTASFLCHFTKKPSRMPFSKQKIH